MTARPGRLLVLSAWLLAAKAHAGNVIVVDSGGSGDYFRIQRAIDAAADGDTILVKSGTYQGFSIVNKRVSVVAEDGQLVMILGTVQVTDLAVTRDVILAGLTVEGTGHGFEILNAAGSVRVQSCTASGAELPANSWHGALVEGCDDVGFARCDLEGGRDMWISGAGIRASDSRIALHDCTLRGGHGVDADCPNSLDGGQGGPGAWADSSFLFASGTSFQGGNGGNGADPCYSSANGGNGGYGLLLAGSGNEGAVLQCSFGGGLGGEYGCGPFLCGDVGWNALPTAVAIGSILITIPQFARRLVTPTVAREPPAVVPLTITGQAGDTVFLSISRQTSFEFVPNQSGVRFTPQSPPPVVLNLGTIPANGTLNAAIPSFDLGAGVESRSYFLQALHRLPNGQRVLGSPASVVILDSSF